MTTSDKLSKLITLFKLGPHNLVWASYYRLLLRLGIVTKHMTIKAPIEGPFFSADAITANSSLTQVAYLGFGWCEYEKGIPNWNKALVSNIEAKLADKLLTQTHWSSISDFDLNVGDIKTVWEKSRFDWLLSYTVDYLRTGEQKHISQINEWLTDWCKTNPTNAGINWKCGQEASIRVMHISLTALLTGQFRDLQPALINLIEQHLERIAPTVLYAMAQDNNHGTSEASALFIGGALLHKNCKPNGKSWLLTGRKWLENRAQRLIEQDGSFSQYSVNYHRVMLDSFSLCEVFRRKLELEQFSDGLYKKLNVATNWLFQMTDLDTGDVPNIGANDGARLYPITTTDYRDYRPSVQLASALFCNEFKYPVTGLYHQTTALLLPDANLPIRSKITSRYFSNGGYVSLIHSGAKAYFRVPKFKFRPGQADVFHLDVWIAGNNVLRDGGSFSYNSGEKWLTYFSGIESHNSIQFDELQPMRKLSRFLYGDWVKAQVTQLTLEKTQSLVEASYQTYTGAKHNRLISMDDDSLSVIDTVAGFNTKAVLRWRLAPVDWRLTDNILTHNNVNITIECNSSINRLELTQGYESRYYLKKSPLPVLEIEVSHPSTITTLIKWNK